jgi:hypothetical protein
VVFCFTTGFGAGLTAGFAIGFVALKGFGLPETVGGLPKPTEFEELLAVLLWVVLLWVVLLVATVRALTVEDGVSGNEDGKGVLEVMALGGLPPSTLRASKRRGKGTCNGAGSARLLESKVPSRSSICPGTLCARLFQPASMMVSVNTVISARQKFCLVILERLLGGRQNLTPRGRAIKKAVGNVLRRLQAFQEIRRAL